MSRRRKKNKASRKNWSPDVSKVDRQVALRLIASTTAAGFTRKFLSSIGVPWPPPPNWKSRLCSELSDHYQIMPEEIHKARKRPKMMTHAQKISCIYEVLENHPDLDGPLNEIKMILDSK